MYLCNKDFVERSGEGQGIWTEGPFPPAAVGLSTAPPDDTAELAEALRAAPYASLSSIAISDDAKAFVDRLTTGVAEYEVASGRRKNKWKK